MCDLAKYNPLEEKSANCIRVTTTSCRNISTNNFNRLESEGNYSATSNNMKLVHWPLMGGLYSKEGIVRGPRPILAVPNVTSHPSTASVPITVLLYNGPLLCGFNVDINGLSF